MVLCRGVVVSAEKRKCLNCKFVESHFVHWDDEDGTGPQDDGQYICHCKKNAPVVMTLTRSVPGFNKTELYSATVFPEIDEDNCCGDHEYIKVECNNPAKPGDVGY